MIDTHTHSKYSHDGKASIKSLIDMADNLKLDYFAITEHYDLDYKFGKKERFCRQLNLDKYKKAFDKAKARYNGNTFIAFGIECGYDKRLEDAYQKAIDKYDFDVVINSVHTLDGIEAYFGDMFIGKGEEEVYNKYLDTLIDSVYSKYPCNIISHIGYVTRYAKYGDNRLYKPKYFDKIDELLKAIIQNDKTLEINTHISKNGMEYLPEYNILVRYKELGGSNITFSSDAHSAKFIGDKYDLVCSAVKDLGFKEWTIYKKRLPYKIEIK